MVVIFDLDGTLVNTITDLGNACNHALQAFDLPTHSIAEYPFLVGNGINKLIERALPEALRTEEMISKVRRHFIAYYDVHSYDFSVPYDGIMAVLQTLKKQPNTYLAVASNKYHEATQRIIDHFFPQVFDVVFGERPNVPRKPEPQIVENILDALPQNALEKIYFVGDSLVDIQTARNAKIPVISCTWGFCSAETIRDAKPDFVVDKPQELMAIFGQK